MTDRHVPRFALRADRRLFGTLGRLMGWRFAERVVRAVMRKRRRERV